MRHPAFDALRCALGAWLFAVAGCGPSWAHKGSDAYLEVQQVSASAANADALRDVQFTLSLAIKDLDLLVPVDANADARVTWGEIRSAMPQVLATADQGARLDAPQEPASACALRWRFAGLEQRADGAYARLEASAACPPAQALALRYTLLAGQDTNHRLLVSGRLGGQDVLTTTSPLRADPLPLLAAPDPATQPASRTAAGPVAGTASRWGALRDYFLLGVHHLLEGYDHLAFLLALVLPLQLTLFPAARAGSPETGRGDSSTGAWWGLLRTVTAFTVGHSITLLLVTVGWVQASAAWVEPAIALSIAITASLNLRPLPWVRTDALALLFGLVHGIGFAGLLQEAAAPSSLLPWALAGFNLGVEAGQLLAVLGWLALVQTVVARHWYARVVMRGGSVLLILVATWWFLERVR